MGIFYFCHIQQTMQYVHMKLNQGLLCKISIQQEEESFN